MMLPLAIGAAQGSRSILASEPQGVIEQAVMSAMATAINSGLLTYTASVSGKLPADVQAVLQFLKSLGYAASVSGTTLTVTWS